MIIDINGRVRVRFDSTCWSVEKRQDIGRGKEAGGVRWPSIGYYGSVNEALYAIISKHVDLLTDVDRMPIQKVVELIESTRTKLLELAKNKTFSATECTIP